MEFGELIDTLQGVVSSTLILRINDILINCV